LTIDFIMAARRREEKAMLDKMINNTGDKEEKGKPVRLSGAQAFVQALIDQGVDTIFGYPGGSVLPIYDAIYQSPLRHILVRHEQAAAHAADGYARATGRPGVCLATS